MIAIGLNKRLQRQISSESFLDMNKAVKLLTAK